MIETAPVERGAEAYAHMMEGKARFRMVLVTGQWRGGSMGLANGLKE
jgi:hypothetical protein